MNLINRYVSEVGKHLPLVMGREDIEKELRSTLEDMLEERAEKEGRPADEAMEIELLKEYGAPQKVAETYNPHPYLIGPRVFPFFLMILKISIFGVLVGMSVVTIIELITEITAGGYDYVQIVLQGFGRIFSVSMSAFGYIVLAFAIIERYVPDFKVDFEEQQQEWDPTSLTKEPAPHSIKRGELVTEIVFTVIGLAFLNWLLQQPFFSDEFRKLTPWIIGLCFAEIVLDIYLLRSAVWSTITYVAKIIIEAGNIALAVVILRTPDIIDFTAKYFLGFTDSSLNPEQLLKIFNLSFSIAMIIVIIVAGFELAKAGYGLFKINYRKK